jgi:hypothetical protein
MEWVCKFDITSAIDDVEGDAHDREEEEKDD